eukprot:1136292-Pelagomonas_calceolata.AAC.2
MTPIHPHAFPGTSRIILKDACFSSSDTLAFKEQFLFLLPPSTQNFAQATPDGGQDDAWTRCLGQPSSHRRCVMNKDVDQPTAQTRNRVRIRNCRRKVTSCIEYGRGAQNEGRSRIKWRAGGASLGKGSAHSWAAAPPPSLLPNSANKLRTVRN